MAYGNVKANLVLHHTAVLGVKNQGQAWAGRWAAKPMSGPRPPGSFPTNVAHGLAPQPFPKFTSEPRPTEQITLGP